MTQFKDVGITRNSDLEEAGVDEYAHLDTKRGENGREVSKKSKKK